MVDTTLPRTALAVVERRYCSSVQDHLVTPCHTTPDGMHFRQMY
jgi:hypothetical protein